MQAAPRRRRNDLADTLRRRVVGAVSAGTLRRGDRLPSAREVAADFDADPRLVLAAYRILAREGIVEIRRRSGIYVAGTPEVAGGPAVVADGWLVDTLAQGVEHGVSITRLGDWLKRVATTRRLRAAVIAETADQRDAFCVELRDDYGVDPVPFAPDALDRPGGPAPELLGADFALTVDALAGSVQRALAPLGKRTVVVAYRWRAADAMAQAVRRGAPMYVVATDPRTRDAMAAALEPELVARMQVLVAGRDDLAQIPPTAIVYVTRSAQRRLGEAAIPGRRLPPERVFSPGTARGILELIVSANLAALRG